MPDFKIMPDSKIGMKYDEVNFIKECFDRPFETELLYRGSDHGFAAKDFHTKCDNKGANISIIKSEHGLIFGGYTSLSWESLNNKYFLDNDAFIFSVSKKTKHLCHDK